MWQPIPTLRAMLCGAFLVVSALATTGCAVRWSAESPDGYYEDEPPDEYIDVTTPVYFEGHATYWYGNRWYYRNGGRWRTYRREPVYLFERRGHAPPRRRTYEPARPRPSGRSHERHERHR